MPEQRQDAQDKQFGAQGRRDAEALDATAGEGGVEGAAGTRPRAGDEAEPVPGECRLHEAHDHGHGEGCGHESVEHDGHTDYLHDGHRHAAHSGHWDEH